MKDVIKLMRMKHYIKNLLIFIPLFFSGNLFVRDDFMKGCLGFVIFSLTASIVYVNNDIVDVEKDRAHSTKCERPIASGRISIKQGYGIIAVLGLIILLISMLVLKNINFVWVPLGYFSLNIAYSYYLKNIPIIDVYSISLGFLLRLFYGSELIAVEISSWLFITVLFGTLFLGFGKRRNEMLKQDGKTRKCLEKYSQKYLEQVMVVCLSLTMVFFSLWTIETDPSGLLTKITVLLASGLGFKYYLGLDSNDGDPTDILYRDKTVFVIVIALFIALFYVIYLAK